MPFAWKGLIAMIDRLLAPGIQGAVGNAQFSCNLGFRFVTGSGELHRLVLKLGSKGRLWFWHDHLLFLSRSACPHSTIPLNWGKIKYLTPHHKGKQPLRRLQNQARGKTRPSFSPPTRP